LVPAALIPRAAVRLLVRVLPRDGVLAVETGLPVVVPVVVVFAPELLAVALLLLPGAGGAVAVVVQVAVVRVPVVVVADAAPIRVAALRSLHVVVAARRLPALPECGGRGEHRRRRDQHRRAAQPVQRISGSRGAHRSHVKLLRRWVGIPPRVGEGPALSAGARLPVPRPPERGRSGGAVAASRANPRLPQSANAARRRRTAFT